VYGYVEQPVGTHSNHRLLQLLRINPSSIKHIDEFTAVLLHAGDNKKFESLLYATVQSLLMGRRGQKHASADVTLL
jgi:hypothetical protein